MSNVVLMGIVSFLTDISSEMIYPLIPVFLIGTFAASPVIIGVIEGVSHSLGSFFKIYFGYLSDKSGKRKIMAASGYATSGLGKLIIALSQGWPTVLFGRITDRFGKAVRNAPRDALITESTQPGKRGAAFGLHRAMDTAGAVVGILIGYLILINANGAVRNVFFWSLIPAVLGVLVMIFFVREPKKPEQSVSEKKSIKFRWSVLPKELKTFLLISLLFSLGTSSNLFLILKAIDIGFFPVRIMLLYATFTLAQALIIYPASKLSDKVGRKNLLIAGYFLFGLVYLAFAFVTEQSLYWILFLIYGAYVGLTEGVEKAYIADSAPQEIRATALGTHATIVGVMTLPASVLAGTLWQFFGPATPFYFSASIGFIVTILVILYLRNPSHVSN